MNLKKIINIELDEIDSTQSFARKNFKNFKKGAITCILAKKQTKGVGRFSRRWHSPPGNIYATFFFSLKKREDIPALTHILAISLVDLLKRFSITSKIYWPNDIYIKDKKLSGILCEVIFEEDVLIFLGIGININMEKGELSKIDKKATSLKLEIGKNIDLELFLKNLQEIFLKNLEIFLKEGFLPFKKRYESLLYGFKKKVSIISDKKYTGILDSVGKNGECKLILENGEEKYFSSGDMFL